jgi:hypothetical protein
VSEKVIMPTRLKIDGAELYCLTDDEGPLIAVVCEHESAGWNATDARLAAAWLTRAAAWLESRP